VAQHFGYLNNIQWIPVHFKIRYDFGNHLNEEENLRLPLPLDFFLPVMLLPGMEVKKVWLCNDTFNAMDSQRATQ
jgi:hypothetical protein